MRFSHTMWKASAMIFFPDVLDNTLVDQYVKINDQNSFDVARRLIKEEGLLCGGSSGTVVWAALQAAKTLHSGQKCLCILADGIRNYLGKFVSDDWMKENGFFISINYTTSIRPSSLS